MRILSIGKTLQHPTLEILSIKESELATHTEIETYDYIIINGGDGTVRRILKEIYAKNELPPFILNPTGSFNVLGKLHNVPKLSSLLEKLAKDKKLSTRPQSLYGLNNEIFLFSAGNMGDLQHIFLSETLRFGLLEKGSLKYILAALFLLPAHIFMTPFMLMSKRRFFIFTPLSFIKKFGTFYGVVKNMEIDLKNGYNFIELDGDVVILKESILHISQLKKIEIVTI